MEMDSYDLIADGLRKHVTVEKSHGRNERREYYVIAASAEDKQELQRWPGPHVHRNDPAASSDG